MNDNIIIKVSNITKSFRIYLDKGNTFKEKIIFKKRRKYEEREVIKGISLEVEKGEAIGLIGHNGCGKSTILKLLTRIMYPDTGYIDIKGRVSSLIELGAGFHPDMSGRENIYINASILGLSKKEIDKKLDDIITFSELEEFIDNPVRTYSSGMYMRLAFSVAINVNADVLLIDEILAVGDVNFQQKCFEKLKEIKKFGTTIVIVSHSLSQIEQICDKTIWIDKGIIREEGKPKLIHEKYLSIMEKERMDRIAKEEQIKENNKTHSCTGNRKGNQDVDKSKDEKFIELPFFCNNNSIRRGNQKVIFKNIILQNESGENKNLVRAGEEIKFVIECECKIPSIESVFGIGIYRDDGIYCYGTNTDIEVNKTIEISGNRKIEIVIPCLQLLAGKYNVNVAVHSKDAVEIYDYIWNVIEFQVFNAKGDDGLFRMQTLWYQDGVLIVNSK